jgi:glycosyltransferase involved in cell wall biosynthesis
LVSDIEGLRDPIIKDQTGVVVQKEPKSIAKGIVSLLGKKKQETCIEQIKKTSLEYSWSTFVVQWDAFVSQIKNKANTF